MASLLALVKRKSRQRFLQTPGKTNYNNVTALFSLFYFPEMLVGGGGIGEQKWSGLVPVQWNRKWQTFWKLSFQPWKCIITNPSLPCIWLSLAYISDICIGVG